MKRIHIFIIASLLVYLGPNSLFAQWVKTGLSIAYVNALAVGDSSLYAGGTDYMGLFVSTDDGTDWTEIDSALGKPSVGAIAIAHGDLFAGINYRGLFRSTDNGATWIQVDSGFIGYGIFAIAVSGNNIAIGNGDGVTVSKDGGKTWTRKDSGLTNTDVRSLAFKGSKLFAGTGNFGNVFVSNDTGASWKEADSGLARSDSIRYVESLAVMGTEIFAATSYVGVFKSSDDGASWQEIDSAIVNDPTKNNLGAGAIVISGGDIFVGTDAAVYLSADTGKTWTDVGTGLPGGSSPMIISKNYLFGATAIAGLWRRPLSEMITAVKDEVKYLPSRFGLQQNFPNPFNPTTVITYDIAKSSHVRLTVYDVLGREVSTLVNAEKSPGQYRVTFDGSGLASGVYFYRLDAGKYVSTRKLLLLK